MQRRRRKLSTNVHTHAMLKNDHRKNERDKVSKQHIKGVSAASRHTSGERSLG